ncbi:hypothetical protein HMPREF9554_01558 [Treponema phagedenis F0421]|nr:hypothetical protein HMPREF9554_01558 [Treponema phagedenis F0421]
MPPLSPTSFKASILQFCVDALKNRSELRTGEPLELLPLVRQR